MNADGAIDRLTYAEVLRSTEHAISRAPAVFDTIFLATFLVLGLGERGQVLLRRKALQRCLAEAQT